MPRKLLVSLVAVGAIALLGTGVMWGQDKGSARSKPKVSGTPAPDFELKDLDGKSHKLSAYKDKIVVLEWVEPGCPYVKRHYKNKNMQNLAKKYGDKVVWLAVWSGSRLPVDAMKKFRDTYSVKHPILLDRDGKVGKSYKARTTPHMYVIANGVKVYEGALDDDKYGKSDSPANYVTAAIDDVMAGKKVSNPSTTPYG